MSLHNKILAIRGDTEDNSASYALGLCDAKQEAAALAIKADQEIDRLRSDVAACAPYLKDGESPVDRILRDVRDNDALMSLLASEKKIGERLAGENAVLRDLLRGFMATIEVVEVDDGKSSEPVIALLDRINAVLNVTDGGPFGALRGESNDDKE